MSGVLKASSLLPRFQKVLSKWPVDPMRNEVSAREAKMVSKAGQSIPNRDLGLYLHMFVNERVADDKVSYEFAEKELLAAERLTKGDYFEKFNRQKEGGMRSELSVEEVRAVIADPHSREGKRALGKERYPRFTKVSYTVQDKFWEIVKFGKP